MDTFSSIDCSSLDQDESFDAGLSLNAMNLGELAKDLQDFCDEVTFQALKLHHNRTFTSLATSKDNGL